MARCHVQVLGGFQVSVDGKAVPGDAWRTRRAADLVKVLALEPSHTIHREQLMELLWGDLGEEAAGSNLRKAIHYARRAMGSAQAVGSRAGMLSLWDGDLAVDADRFMALADAAEASGAADSSADAARSYPGDALPADRYEPWAIAARDRLRDRYVACLKGAGMWDGVLEVDPADDEAHRALMQGHFEAGRRREALRQFDRMREALREFMGVGPDRDTIALYERVLAMDGAEPPTPAQQAAQLIATGLVSLNAGDLVDAERGAREAREIALAGQLGHELGDASTLLALASSMSGRWQEVFEEDFAASMEQPLELAHEIYDAHMCFIEYYVSGVDGFAAADYARQLLAQAEAADSAPAKGMAHVMLGEALLLAGELGAARPELERAYEINVAGGPRCGLGLSLEHLAELDLAQGKPGRARTRLDEALDVAQRSALPSHQTVRVLGVQVRAARNPAAALRAVEGAERILADANRVCQPCSINFHVQATAACARAGQVARARGHLESAERIVGLWQGGPWSAAVWEARAEVRLADHEWTQATALFREAADAFERAQRPTDAARCRAAAEAVDGRSQLVD
jgi:DNA-binding SARP family transcriptional activator